MGSTVNGEGRVDQAKQLAEELSKTLKEGERILAPTRRPDGTFRKPIRIRAGYTPQDEVAIYKSKGSLLKQEMQSLQEVPPGYNPVEASKPKTKAAKRNERKKEKRQQASLEKDKDLEDSQEHEQPIASQLNELSLSVDSTNNNPSNPIASQLNELSLSVDSTNNNPSNPIASQLNELSLSVDSTNNNPSNSTEDSTPADKAQDIDKKIRALKKKIRLAEAQLQKTAEQGLKPEQSEKLAKLEGWREELKILEDKKAEMV